MDPTDAAITGMNHFTVLTDDLDRTRAFYALLGLREGERPPLGFPGAWLYADGRAVLHIVAGRPLPAQPAGVLDHMAFSARGLAALVDRLRARGIAHELRRQPASGVWQLFLFDPNGAKVELDFDPGEAPPAALPA
jgi:catechol 2,3-dioxygenase-like lactoylglutathione lyase family enzyme